jgi:hypothetical protein
MNRNAGATITVQRETPRRRYSKTGARHGMKLGNAELDELVSASALVPTGEVRKSNVDSETLSTAVPSSAEHSPELNCLASDAENWPSLREAVEVGWDFCSEGSDLEELWEDLPEPAMPVDLPESERQEDVSPKSWMLIPAGDESEHIRPKTADVCENEVIQKPTFADVLRDEQCSQMPPAAGTAMPSLRARTLPRRSQTGAGHVYQDINQEDLQDLQSARQHGWTREHKASRNARQQRKVADREARRVTQSCKARGWLDDQEEI